MLQCHICNKPFTSASSHTRHVRYCLRTRNRPRVRQKSCQACSASKVKCTFQRPSCARCDKKGIGCVYDGEEVRSRADAGAPEQHTEAQYVIQEPTIQPPEVAVEPWQPKLSLATDRLIDWTSIDLFLPDDFSIPPADIGGNTVTSTFYPETTYSDLSNPILAPNLDLQPQSADLSTSASAIISTSSEYGWIPGPATGTTPTISDSAQSEHQQQIRGQTISPSLPTALAHPSILTLRDTNGPHTRLPNSPTATQYSITSIIRGLRSYPLMMLQKETFPPLIHPHLLNMHTSSLSSSPSSSSSALSPSTTHSASSSQVPCPTPSSIISRCMSIAHLYALRTPETTPYLWDAILEQTHSFKAHLQNNTFTIESLTAAIQAQLIYVIMRIVTCASSSSSSSSSSTTSQTNPDMALNINYTTMWVFKRLCETFVERHGTEELYYHAYMAPTRPPPPNHSQPQSPQSKWEEWIISESWRRMKVIFFLIEKIVDVNMGASVKCTGRYSDVDWIMLPCSRVLWEARSAVEWEERMDICSGENNALIMGGLGMGIGFGIGGGTSRRLETIGGLLKAHWGSMGLGLGGAGGGSFGVANAAACAEALDRWNVEADGLGALLNASLGMM